MVAHADCLHTLGLTFPDFDLAPKRKVCVSVTWLLWVLRSFWRFTLHYMIEGIIPRIII